MLLLAFLLIPAILAVELERTIDNHIVKIDGDTLISVTQLIKCNSTPTSCVVLDLSGLGLRILTENAFENLTTLKDLDLGSNSLSSIPEQLFSNLENLEHLSLANNNLTNFKKVFEDLDNLKTLNISNNPVNDLKATALSGLPRSSVVFTKGIPLKVINAFVFEEEPGTFYRGDEFRNGSISNDQNPTIQAQNQNDSAEMEGSRRDDVNNNRLIKICIDGDVLIRVEPLIPNETLLSYCRRGALKNRRTLDLNNLGIAKFEYNWYGLDKTTSIIRIVLAANDIVHVTPQMLNDLPANVRKIDLSRNKIEYLEKGIMENKRIRVMNLGSNAIRKIERGAFTNIPRLRELYLNDNLLDNTRFMATLPGKIRTLLVQWNKITEISPLSFSTLGSLRFLHLDGNLIQELKSDSLHGLGHLLELVLSNNRISKIEPECFQQVTEMQSLTLNNNKIASFENGTFDHLRELRRLHVRYNKLSDIKRSFPNGLPPKLSILDLGFNGIEKLDRDNFKNLPLTDLNLGGNRISEIEHGALELPALRSLILDNNRLTQLDTDSFRGLNNINALDLAHNSITSIPKRFTKNMDRLDELDLSYNPIDRLQNGALYGFRKTAYNRVYVKEVPVKIIEGGLFDDM